MTPIAITPEQGATVATSAIVDFSATGGSGSGFTWSLEPGSSGATIDPATGIYVAGSRPDVVDVIVVRDDLSNAATARVAVVQRANLAGGGLKDNSWECGTVAVRHGVSGSAVLFVLALGVAFFARRRRID